MLTSVASPSPALDTNVQGASLSANEHKGGKRPDLSSKATEFESMLLAQWLQNSETSFGTVPGGEEDEDAGSDQMKSFAFQHLASGLAEKGGIGLAKMVRTALTKEAEAGTLPANEPTTSATAVSYMTAAPRGLVHAAASRQAPERAQAAYANAKTQDDFKSPEGR